MNVKKFILTAALVLFAAQPVMAEEKMSEDWEKISIDDVKNPAVLFGKDWAALAAGNKDGMNAMTIGWGQFGMLWQRPILTVYVAPERYTNEFMDKSEYFTVSTFPESKRKALSYIGTHSGRDGDKLKEAGLTPDFTELGNPVFKEANLVVECKIIYKEPFKSELMDDKAKAFYERTKLSPHVQYIGEVINVWRKK